MQNSGCLVKRSRGPATMSAMLSCTLPAMFLLKGKRNFSPFVRHILYTVCTTFIISTVERTVLGSNLGGGLLVVILVRGMVWQVSSRNNSRIIGQSVGRNKYEN